MHVSYYFTVLVVLNLEMFNYMNSTFSCMPTESSRTNVDKLTGLDLYNFKSLNRIFNPPYSYLSGTFNNLIGFTHVVGIKHISLFKKNTYYLVIKEMIILT